MRAFGALLTVLAGVASISAAATPNFDWALPEGVDPPPVPADNPMSVMKVELGQRLVRALQCYADGHSLTEAAHHASFADSAHFSRVFRRYFGLPATTLRRL